MSAKGCENHCKHNRHRLYRQLFWCLLAIIIVILLVILIIWLVLRPTKPRFSLQGISVTQFNLSSDPNTFTSNPNLLTSNLQATISSRNPNDNIGIYYDKLDVFASYKSQQITVACSILPSYQGHNDVSIWSPYLIGTSVPIAPFLAASLGQDQSAGYLLLYIKIDGRLRWKVGSWISGSYHVFITCPAYLTIDNSQGSGISPSIRFQQISTCSVDV